MLVGHFAIGLIGKRAAPHVSLGTLTVASMLPDLLGFVFIITGLEHWRMVPGGRGIESVELYDIGLSHSLAMDAVWGVLFAAFYRWRRGYGAGALMLFAAVVVIGCWISSVTGRTCRSPRASREFTVWDCGLRCPGPSPSRGDFGWRL
jgi:membrane-bound metal-dependent hydrolase YbcI (DUF457 family)